MRMYNRVLPAVVYVAPLLNTSDVPAYRKLNGAAGHSHKTHPCNFCFATLADINTLDGYDNTSKLYVRLVIEYLLSFIEFKLRDDWESLKEEELSRRATTDKDRKDILNRSGMRYSEFNELPGWMPSQLTVVDYMHNFYGEL